MKKGICLLAVLGMLAVMASCNYSSHDKTILGSFLAKAKIQAKAATFQHSEISGDWSTISSTFYSSMISDDASWDIVTSTWNTASTTQFWGPYAGAVEDATIVYRKFTSSYSLTYSSLDDAYDTYGVLHVQQGGKGMNYGFQGTTLSTVGFKAEDGNRELVWPVLNMFGLDVSRKLWVNPIGNQQTESDFCRWLDILTNNSGSPITVSVVFAGNVGSDSDTRVIASSDGDAVIEAGVDDWLISRDGTSNDTSTIDPIVGHLFDGSMGYSEVDAITMAMTQSSVMTVLDWWTTGWSTTPYDTATMTTSASSDSVIFRYNDVTVNPGETKILMHLGVLTALNVIGYSNGSQAAVETAMALDQAPAVVVTSMDPEEINAVTNWPAARKNCNITGPEKSVAPGVLVSAQNLTAATAAQSYSLPDGSFGICLDAAVGDTIKLTADGTLVKQLKATE